MSLFAGYAAWIAGLRDWLVVKQYTDTQIALFLKLAQIRLNTELASYRMEAVAPFTTNTIGAPIDIESIVPDFNRIRLIEYPGVGSLTSMAINEIVDKLNADTELTGEPTHYCIDAGKLYLYPRPNAIVQCKLYYYVTVAPIDEDVDDNIFTDYHSDLLLYAASLEAAPYMAEDERIPVWEAKYNNALANGNDLHKRIKMGSTPLQREFRSI